MKKETVVLVGLLALVGVALGARAGRAAREGGELEPDDLSPGGDLPPGGSSSSFAPPVATYPTREAAPRVPGRLQVPDGPPPPTHAWVPQTIQQWCMLAETYRFEIQALYQVPGGIWTGWHADEAKRLFILEKDAREHCEA